ncbi:NAD(P)H-dependent FMN reductase [Chitinophaga costaii]|uniref:NAD(P)H-dependent FMN reductase n=1 Tax=Chitinophaga costaii TaxID=1335309 RepID=A0A1C4E2K8_9BACT|nr:NAD(P)H-dependent oxidoreductase [Chitinophaga costaii]PUZ24358.1 NAD(P)H-dependent oxidoreductase [Chitinophaga costaii]SCC37780.1 NAD(P)H-dependent FMN reductase [Chitinophaga costaii]
MHKPFNVLAISGSTRARSTNLNLIRAIAGMSAELFNVTIYDGLLKLPHFNPDEDTEPGMEPPAITAFRKTLRAADAILICSPEYAFGVPGVLKDAIDWTVSSMEFYRKPVALITASTSGHKAHASLLDTLLVIDARITEDTQLVVPAVKTKVNQNYQITDAGLLQQLQKLIQSLYQVITAPDSVTKYLVAPSMY